MEWAAMHFRQRFPGVYCAPCWGTTDQVIPYRRFWLEFTAMTNHLAVDRLNTAVAIAMVLADEGGVLQKAARRDAFPSLPET